MEEHEVHQLPTIYFTKRAVVVFRQFAPGFSVLVCIFIFCECRLQFGPNVVWYLRSSKFHMCVKSSKCFNNALSIPLIRNLS